ncbi:MAG: hypothetical protein A2W90_05005 [Bacteroidetes bacterium GWF2_42_66]|nr:MAG: hypothetical protein A2W89_21225 [Bacteroidetes bacterium GWE2_42_39]OFY40844.1 MAG: hypothetical protein A2W90_05005 [Bacteroidetes bacterium GWF2_42_66]HBL75864.1 hypothetical protein [Prolixibacteraceae bacterium]HCU63113.1 hypothetical protein [Prolixibacteraceae bacterium]
MKNIFISKEIIKLSINSEYLNKTNFPDYCRENSSGLDIDVQDISELSLKEECNKYEKKDGKLVLYKLRLYALSGINEKNKTVEVEFWNVGEYTLELHYESDFIDEVV